MRRIIALALPSTPCRAADPVGAGSIVTLFVQRFWTSRQRRKRRATRMPDRDNELAGKVLRTTLLSAPGADFALLHHLGALFTKARRLLSRDRLTARRQPPLDRPAPLH